jgi:hypothetical protein
MIDTWLYKMGWKKYDGSIYWSEIALDITLLAVGAFVVMVILEAIKVG